MIVVRRCVLLWGERRGGVFVLLCTHYCEGRWGISDSKGGGMQGWRGEEGHKQVGITQ